MAAQKLSILRAWMRQQKIDVLVVPHADTFQSEYLADRDERLAWLTGFTGSNALVLITAKHAALFTDVRYMLQAPQEVDKKLYTILEMPQAKPLTWLQSLGLRAPKIGLDPWLLTVQQATNWHDIADALGGALSMLVQNPLDAMWHDRPAAVAHKAEEHALKYAGVSRHDKIKQVITKLQKDAGALLISSPELVCWLLNIRGRDVAHVPVLHARALLHADGRVTLYTAIEKISAALQRVLGKNITVAPLEKLLADLVALKTAIQFDPSSCPLAVQHTLQQKKIITADDPCIILRACKNDVEIAGAILAHKKDAAAFKKFLAWWHKRDFKREVITELDVAAKLRACRALDPDFIDDSFDTIAGFGANGAIIHYRADAASNKRLMPGNLLLLDSGAQYRCGTTDITRTLAVGKPTPLMKKHYRAVYNGLQNLCHARFPVGTTGAQLDALARAPLWQAGLDFGHGTGHGVGCFMGVHEGPQGFTPRSFTPLAPGMLITVEPGVYHAGQFGIRLENMVVVTLDPRPHDMKPMLRLRVLTDVPFDKKLLD